MTGQEKLIRTHKLLTLMAKKVRAGQSPSPLISPVAQHQPSRLLLVNFVNIRPIPLLPSVSYRGPASSVL